MSAIRFVVLAPEFDASAWMDAIAGDYEEKPGWEVDRHRGNETFPESMSNTFWAPAGNTIRVSRITGKLTEIGFNAREDAVGEPAQHLALTPESGHGLSGELDLSGL